MILTWLWKVFSQVIKQWYGRKWGTAKMLLYKYGLNKRDMWKKKIIIKLKNSITKQKKDDIRSRKKRNCFSFRNYKKNKIPVSLIKMLQKRAKAS